MNNRESTSITATLSVRNWESAIDFYKEAFGAVELFRVEGGGVGQLAVSGAPFWVTEESPEHLNFSPESIGGCSVRMLMIVEDPKAVCDRAVAPGATQLCRLRMRMGGVLVGLLIRLVIIGRLENR